MNQIRQNKINVLKATAESHAARKDWPQAIAHYEAALELAPEDADILVQLSYVHSLSGQYRLAHDCVLRAHAANPSAPRIVQELVARLRTFNEAEAIHQLIARLPPIEDLPIPVLLTFAAQLSYLNEQDRALAFLDEAKRADPDFPTTLAARAQVLMYLGRFDDAEADLERCIARAPEIAQAHWLLARLRRQTVESNHIDRLNKRAALPSRRPEDAVQLHYALHKELDDIGEHEASWAALDHACRAKRARLQYRREDSRDLFQALMAMPPHAPDGESMITGLDDKTPIFIVGMHRSGTTLLEQLLDGHSQVRGLGELYDFTSQMRQATDHHCRGVIDRTIVERAGSVDHAEVGKGYLKGVDWRLGEERFFTDKLPSNFLNIGFICQALPQARILHMVRDPMEVCFSNLRELFSDANPYSYDQLELADYYLQYEKLMNHWKQSYPDRIMDVGYAELTRDTETVIRRVSDFCGVEFEPDMLDPLQRKRGVATASAVQVREGVVARKQAKWVPYAAHLKPLQDALGYAD